MFIRFKQPPIAHSPYATVTASVLTAPAFAEDPVMVTTTCMVLPTAACAGAVQVMVVAEVIVAEGQLTPPTVTVQVPPG